MNIRIIIYLQDPVHGKTDRLRCLCGSSLCLYVLSQVSARLPAAFLPAIVKFLSLFGQTQKCIKCSVLCECSRSDFNSVHTAFRGIIEKSLEEDSILVHIVPPACWLGAFRYRFSRA